jgi:HlyD family secretion protein
VSTRVVLTAGAVAALAVGAIAYYRVTRPDDTPTIVTAPVTRGDVVEAVDATGTLQAVTTVQVGTQVSGTIKALHADFNSKVRRGQVVAELEPSLFETQVEQARATVVRLEAESQRSVVQLEDAENRLRRARELAARQLISTSDLETAETTARQAEAALRAAEAQIVQAQASLNQSRVNLAHTIIKAPIDGIVISRNVDVGQTVAASMQAPTLFVIARDLTEMQVEASVAESDIGRVRTGQSVSFRVDAYPDDVFAGRVSQVRLQPTVEQNVVSYVTVIDVPNPALTLKPGMTANVTVEIARAADVLRVPNAALRVRPSPELFAALGQSPEPALPPGALVGEEGEVAAPLSDVWVLIGGRLERATVQTGISDGTRTAILAGPLTQGAEVVTSIANSVTPAPSTGTSPLLPAGRRGGAGRSGGSGRPPGA